MFCISCIESYVGACCVRVVSCLIFVFLFGVVLGATVLVVAVMEAERVLRCSMEKLSQRS